MKLEQRLINMVSEKDYQSCWKTINIPPFDSFFKILVDRVSKILPKEMFDLNIKIDSSSEGRINVGGNFNTPNSQMRIWGQIIWLPKSDNFRGKLGTSEIKTPLETPEDISTHFTIKNDTYKNLNAFGTTILLKPFELTKRFRLPSEADNFKASGIYIFEGNCGSTFRLHDYEATSLYWDENKYPNFPSKNEFWSSTENYEFRIAGSHNASAFIEWLKKELKY